MSEVKYKAVPRIKGCSCEGCCFEKLPYGCMKITDHLEIYENFPSCDTHIFIKDISKVPLEQSREKFESHYQYTGDFDRDSRGEYKNRIMQYRWIAYTNALKDHDILEEGE